ncbi:MAG: hypothetical protein ACO1RT_12610 [Planctomycetaceae bacterium]
MVTTSLKRSSDAGAGGLPARGRVQIPWLFSARVDLLTFLGSAVLSLGLLAAGAAMGWLDSESPGWSWVVGVLLIDVAHVYATGFRVYFDRAELLRRPWLYGLTPLLAFMVGWAIYSEDIELFWRLLAYIAVFHFVRQQYGWVALYRARGGETGRAGWWIDSSAIYLATLYPLAYWHSQLPRAFWWFREGDFLTIAVDVAAWLEPVYWSALLLYAARAVYRAVVANQLNPGKDIVVITTALCWYLGIITFNSDYAFLVTNVIIHGVPYMVLTYWYRYSERPPTASSRLYRVSTFVGALWILAYAEELLWDSGVWHERSWLFGGHWQIGEMETWLVPILAVPQLTHYVLDGFIWKRKSNTAFSAMIDSSVPAMPR